MDTLLQLLSDHGFPIVAATGCGYFIFLMIKFILNGVTNSVKDLKTKIESLDRRVRVMDNDMQRIDILVSRALGINPDLSKTSKADSTDARKD